MSTEHPENQLAEVLRRAAYAYDMDFWYFDEDEDQKWSDLGITEETAANLALVIQLARVACVSFERLIDEIPVGMWVRVYHDRLHQALATLDRVPVSADE